MAEVVEMFTSKCLRRGQSKPYADDEEEWEFYPNEGYTLDNITEEAILLKVKNTRLPYKDWNMQDENTYFKGYYKIEIQNNCKIYYGKTPYSD
ncbi:MAG: hypothetical protein MJ224_01330 [archaeon]|nr:hypothetical protein [archaeon]